MAVARVTVAPGLLDTRRGPGAHVRTLRLLTTSNTHPAVTRLREFDAFTRTDEPDFPFGFGLGACWTAWPS
ncbi:hypothetical protein ABZX75_23450 [Streptomyces sp. NPDC003038]|uniref:hypothetical protein n=1 Tax=Streptomyces sp. NPDC003038 TaxID=3154546 RepID=UPI0033A159FE